MLPVRAPNRLDPCHSKHHSMSLSSTRRAGQRGRSVSIRKEGLSKKEINSAMDIIWRYTNQPHTKQGVETALNLLAKLLEEEQRSGKSILKKGVVFNVLKACRLLGSSSPATADILEKTISSLEENSRLWDANMVPYVIGLLTKLKSQSSMKKAQSLLRGMEDAAANGEGSVRPSLFTYTTMLRCYANRGMCEQAEELFHRMQELHKTGHLDREPDKVARKCVRDARRRAKSLIRQARNTTESASYASENAENFPLFVLNSTSDNSGPDSLQNAVSTVWYHIRKDPEKSKRAKKALLLLNWLLDEENKNHSGALKANTVFNVLRACARQASLVVVDDLETTHKLLEVNGDFMNAKILRELLVAVSICPEDRDAPDRAKDMLRQTKTITPNSYHYNAVLMGYAKRGWAKKAEKLLKEMQGMQIDGPNAVTYNVVLDSLSKSGDSDAVKRAEHIWKKMMKNAGIKPDMFTFTSLFSLYAKNGDGDKSERLLEQVVGLHRAGKLKDGPNAFTYRCVIDALAKSTAPERAEEILYRMQERGIEPNRFHFCGVLGAYARNGKADQCEKLLQCMYESHVAGSLPEAPDVVAFNSVVFAWAKSGADNALSKARGIVDDMINAGILPNLITYNCLLSAAKDGKEAEQMLKQMNELHLKGELEAAPNTVSYNYCLNALATSEVEWTVVRAESLVNEMRESYESGKADSKPNMITYRSLLKCYANWNLAEDAEQLLQNMQNMFKKGEIDYGPDKVSYNLVIDLLRKSDEEGSTERAEALQKQVEEMYGLELVSDSEVRQSDQVDALLEYMGGFGYPSFL